MISLLLPDVEMTTSEEEVAWMVLDWLQSDMAGAHDNLLQAKVQQAAQANKMWQDNFEFQIDNRTLVCTKDKHRLYKKKVKREWQNLCQDTMVLLL